MKKIKYLLIVFMLSLKSIVPAQSVEEPDDSNTLNGISSSQDSSAYNNGDKEDFSWLRVVVYALGVSTIGFGYLAWSLRNKKNDADEVVSEIADKLQRLLDDNHSTIRLNHNDKPLRRLALSVNFLSQNYSIFGKDKQDLVRLRQEVEFFKKSEKDLLDEREAITLEFQDFKNRVEANAKSSKIGQVSEPAKNNVPEHAEQTLNNPVSLFYLSYPSPAADGKGEFYDKRQLQASPTNSYYEFEIDKTESSAIFSFYDTVGTIEGATRNPDTYLNPACDYSAVDPKAKHIKTISKGVAIRVGEVWKVKTKAIIEFC